MIIKEVPVEERFGDLWVLLPDAISMYSCREIDAAVSKRINSSIKRIVLNLSNTYNLFSSGTQTDAFFTEEDKSQRRRARPGKCVCTDTPVAH